MDNISSELIYSMDCINLDGDDNNVDDMVGLKYVQWFHKCLAMQLPSGSSTQSEVWKNGRRRQITPKKRQNTYLEGISAKDMYATDPKKKKILTAEIATQPCPSP